jgi:HK97 family phage portal protein
MKLPKIKSLLKREPTRLVLDGREFMLKDGVWVQTKGTTLNYSGQTLHNWGQDAYKGAGAPTNYSRPFERHPLVFRAISVIAESGGAVDLKLSRYTSSGEREEITSGIEYETLMAPNPEMSTDMLISQILGFMQMACGEAFVRVVRSGSVRRLIIINPERVGMERLKDGSIRFTIDDEPVNANEIIHFKRAFNPYDDLRGIGPLQAAAMVYMDDFDVRRYNRDLVQGGGMPAGFVSFANGEWPTDEQMKQFRDQIDKAQKSQRKIIGIGGGTWQSAGMSTEELAFLETRKLTFREIGGVFGVPPSKLGDYERDQADSQVQKLDFWDTTMIAQLRLLADILRLNMWKISGTSQYAQREIVPYFDFSEVPELVQREMEMRKADRDDLMAGLTTINRVLRRRNEETVPWGDVWWKPMGLTPVEDAENYVDIDPNSGPGAEEPEDDNATDKPTGGDDTYTPPVPKKHAKQHKSVDVTDNLVWLAFVLRTGGFEERMKAALVQSLEEVEDEELKSLGLTTAGARVSRNQILFDMNEFIKKLISRSKPILRDAQNAGGDRGLRMVGAGAAFKIDAREAVAFLNKQSQRFAVPVAETTWNKLQASLSEGFQRGETERELADRVRMVMSVRRYEAARTARTESAAAMNGGITLGFDQSGTVESKVWVTAGDEHVRTEPEGGHRAASGQEVPLHEHFDVGGEKLEFPGDPNGSASNVINCRCTVVPGKIRRD